MQKKQLVEPEPKKPKDSAEKECPICEAKLNSSLKRHLDSVHRISCGEAYRYVMKAKLKF